MRVLFSAYCLVRGSFGINMFRKVNMEFNYLNVFNRAS